ncbi:TPM1 [Lepeophtheirus salmonis]|uniref:TPM1 n=1 Tax=Lepeophtheirus salmonis TaxID=72036 RepID=A0A7R8H9J9_LEPSM|nr:TPM1 [Lepeophtheirus salmonis]CAF2942455.1 TPM1 [Lepeophtheirus salmonis]
MEVNRRSVGGLRRHSGAVTPLRRPNSLPKRPKSEIIESPSSVSTSSKSSAPTQPSPPSKHSTPPPSSEKSSPDDDDEETVELSRLRCTSVRTEETQEKQKEERRKNRCADYPGLAFGSAMFGSDTMMKFNVIKNELHNIMRSQLRRVDGEVSALSQRIKALDVDLEKSEKYIKVATSALVEVVEQEMQENSNYKNEDELSLFDAQMSLLEGKLIEAKVLAAEWKILLVGMLKKEIEKQCGNPNYLKSV